MPVCLAPLFTYCFRTVEEDESAMPKKDSRLLLAKFNDQMEKLYELLRAVEDIRLAPEVTNLTIFTQPVHRGHVRAECK